MLSANIFLKDYLLILRDKACKQGNGGGGGEGEQARERAPNRFALSVQSPVWVWTHEPKDLSQNQDLNWPNHPGTPLCQSFYFTSSNSYKYLLFQEKKWSHTMCKFKFTLYAYFPLEENKA